MSTHESSPPSSVPSPSSSSKAAVSETEALVLHHRRNLDLLDQIPYDQEYVSPQEILSLVMVATEYAVDWTRGLEPLGVQGELTQTFIVSGAGDPEPIDVEREVRVRWEDLAENSEGTLIPDGNTVWAHQLLGILKRAAGEELAGLGLQRRGA